MKIVKEEPNSLCYMLYIKEKWMVMLTVECMLLTDEGMGIQSLWREKYTCAESAYWSALELVLVKSMYASCVYEMGC